jgi:hypothetical protein
MLISDINFRQPRAGLASARFIGLQACHDGPMDHSPAEDFEVLVKELQALSGVTVMPYPDEPPHTMAIIAFASGSNFMLTAGGTWRRGHAVA